jgi:hypothetical protein
VKGGIIMMAMTQELTAAVLENALKHGKFNIPLRNAIENAIVHLTPVPYEMEGGGNIWFDVCGECHVYISSDWKFCPWCGRGILRIENLVK